MLAQCLADFCYCVFTPEVASLCKFDDLLRDDFIIDGLASAFVVKRGSRHLKHKPQQTGSRD